jgi:flagellin-like protein
MRYSFWVYHQTGCEKMKRLFKNKKAVSPVIATVLMILIVMAGMTILFAFVTDYTQSFQAGRGSAVLESLTVEYHLFKTLPSDEYLYIWVYNVGEEKFVINSIYVNDVMVTPALFNSDKEPIPHGTVIDLNEHIEIRVCPWRVGYSYTVKIVTDRGSAFEETYYAS